MSSRRWRGDALTLTNALLDQRDGTRRLYLTSISSIANQPPITYRQTMAQFDSLIESLIADYASRAEQWFTLKFTDTTAFENRLRAGLSFMGPDQYAENKIRLTRNLAMFSEELFQAMICGGESFKPLPIPILWQRLLDAGVVFKAMSAMKGVPFVDHQIDEAKLLLHIRDNTFANLFSVPARLPERYRHSVATVDVFKNGSQFRGTGFIVKLNEIQYFITCKHNVDPADGITIDAITSASGTAIETGPIILSDKFDIAFSMLNESIHGPNFALSSAVEVFDEVFTLGFPYVPRAESILLGHRGELNGHANLYMDKCPALIISNLVSPGSSGGPVLTRDGHCVGMTINWLEGEWGSETNKLEKMRFSAALPAHLLREAIEAIPKT